MTDAARKVPVYIEGMEDAEIDDPDTSLVEALRDSDHPERVMRARRMAARKVAAVTERLRRRQSVPPAR